MTRATFRARWHTTCEELRQAGALVDGAKLLDRVLADFDAMSASEDAETLTLAEAAPESGYSRDHLARLVRAGALPNAGRRGAPRLRRKDLPRKATALRPVRHPTISRMQIARSVVHSDKETDDD